LFLEPLLIKFTVVKNTRSCQYESLKYS
jgi:hypothetical protein